MVALASSYSNRPDLVRKMERLTKLAGQVGDGALSRPVSPPRRLRFRLDEATRVALADDYLAGTPTTELTTKYALSKGSVLQILRAAGIVMRRQGLTDVQADEAVRLYESGLSLAKVAASLGSGSTTVNRALVARGVNLRGRHDRGELLRRQ